MKQSIIVVPAFHGKILIGLIHRDFTKKIRKKNQNMFTLHYEKDVDLSLLVVAH